jgi:hypothetical protein
MHLRSAVLAASDPLTFELDYNRKFQLVLVLIGLVVFAIVFFVIERVGARRAAARRAKKAAEWKPEEPVWNEPPKPKEIYVPQPHKLEVDAPPEAPAPRTEHVPREAENSPYGSGGQTVPPFVSAPPEPNQAYPLPFAPDGPDAAPDIDPMTGLPVFKPREG